MMRICTTKRTKLVIALLFILLTGIGLLTADDYGVYCDQLSEQVILRENMKEYALLTRDNGAIAYYDALQVQPISESLEIDHGQCAYYPFVPILSMLEIDSSRLSELWHQYTWLLFMLGVGALYALLRELGLSRPLAMVGMLLLYLSPRFFAEGHYNNKDIVLLTLCLWIFLLGLRLMKKPTALQGIAFSLAGAMAANTKIVGIAVWGLFSLSAVGLLTAERSWNKKTVNAALATFFSFAAFYTLLTPAMWKNPIEYFSYLLTNASGFTRWPGVVLFRGMVFEHKINPLPRYYLPYLMLTTVPLYFFPLCAIGQISLLKRCAKQKSKLLCDPISLCLLCATFLWVMFIGYVVLTRPLIYNGWRHFYFVYAGLVILAAWGLKSLWTHLPGKSWKRAGATVCGICLVATATAMAVNHPYQYVYYNPLVSKHAEEAMELDYWDVSTVNAVRQLLHADRDQSLPLVLGARDDMSWFGLHTGRAALTPEEREQLSLVEDQNAPYLWVNTTYGFIYGVEPPEGYHPLFTLTGYGNALCTVYEKDGGEAK
ncbi:MAG: hypothetical protein PHI98_03300 [Eubacteriales bacterium]|nr:hypothetical protein [Eubacteriales bacterium]